MQILQEERHATSREGFRELARFRNQAIDQALMEEKDER